MFLIQNACQPSIFHKKVAKYWPFANVCLPSTEMRKWALSLFGMRIFVNVCHKYLLNILQITNILKYLTNVFVRNV